MARLSSEMHSTGRSKQGVLTGSVVAGKYRLDEAIAEGGMGVVYRAWHLVLDQPVVIKVMRPELLDRPDASLRFLNEARATACMRGANVARALDSGAIALEGKKLPYIVLEYLVGADLRTVLERHGALPLDQSVDFILQACEALAEAHLNGIIHRDVKPENLFLAEQSDGSTLLKLLDFGIAKRVGADPLRESAGTHSLGSPHYMAPEQMYLPHGVDARADIWSLGIVLYELLTLRVPFEGDSLAGVYARVVRQEPVAVTRLRPELPAAIDRAIAGCLAKAKRQRTSSVRDLALALAPFGSARSHESLRRIQRLFDRHADTPVEIEVDVAEVSHAHFAESEPMRKRPRIRIGQASFVAFALAVLVVALPARTTIAQMSTKSWHALTPIGERIRGMTARPAKALRRLTLREPASLRDLAPPDSRTVTHELEPQEADDTTPSPVTTPSSPDELAARLEAETARVEEPQKPRRFWDRALAPWAPLLESGNGRREAARPKDRQLLPADPPERNGVARR